MQKTLRKLIVLLLCLCVLFSLVVGVHADFGDQAGDNDFGDIGGGDSDRSSGGDGSGIIELLLWLIIDSNGNINFFWLIVIIVIAAIWFLVKFGRRGKGSGSHRVVTSSPSRFAAQPNLRPISDYTALDPSFSSEAMIQKLSNLYIQFQQCWTKKNIESLRPYLTDALYAQLDRQLEQHRANGTTNYIDRPTVLGVELLGFSQDSGNDHIYALVRTRIIDYRLEDATGKLVSGSKTSEKFMTYRYHLIRPTGMRSDQQEGTRALSCPHCGAPLNINQSAKCPYCDSVITVEKHDFVISQIEAISQVTG